MPPEIKRSRHLPGILARYEPADLAALRPVVLDSPHSGRAYPADFGHRAPLELLRRAEDAFVDDLYEDAPKFGAAFLKALFPRSYIDPNRHADEVDPELLAEPWPRPMLASKKAEMGLGLIRRLIRGNVDIYDRRLSVAEIEGRIDGYHKPYHDELEIMLDEMHARFGAVWHVNCHSMKAMGRSKGAKIPRDDFVLGDLDGVSCDPDFTEFVAATLRGFGYSVRLNHPFKGAELVGRFGRPLAGRHSLQIEVNRGLYMDEEKIEPVAGFDELKRNLNRMIEAIAGFAASQLGLKPGTAPAESAPRDDVRDRTAD
jgi:N-formylglutamate deformylase